jgi:uncharacterized protein YuzE
MNAVLTYDPDVNALYVSFGSAEVAETVQLAKGVFLDVDADRQAVGLEVLNASADLLAGLSAQPDGIDLPALLASRAA